MKQSVLVSDLTGVVIEPGQHVEIKINDTASSKSWIVDASKTDEVVGELLSGARPVARRGRKPQRKKEPVMAGNFETEEFDTPTPSY